MQQPTDPFQAPTPDKTYHDKDAYMPPGVKKAMEEEGMQNPEGPAGPIVMGDVPGQAPAAEPVGPEGQQPGQTIQQPAVPQMAPPSRDQAYDFITNPAPAPKRSFTDMLPSGMAARAGMAAGVLIAVFIVLMILRSIVGSGPSPDQFISVLQDQQEMIHLSAESTQQGGLSSGNQNFVATLGLSMTSSRGELLSYLAGVKQKVTAKELNLKESPATDAQLNAGVTSGTFDQTFKQVMQSELTGYMHDLQSAYKMYTGKNARALLTDSYNQAQLLQTQLNSPAS